MTAKNGNGKPKLVASTGTPGKAKGALEMVLTAILAGLFQGYKQFDATVHIFAPKGRDEYNQLKDAGKIPQCPVKGSTCSNSHYKAVNAKGAEIAISEACGKIIMKWLQAEVSDQEFAKTERAKATKEAKAATS